MLAVVCCLSALCDFLSCGYLLLVSWLNNSVVLIFVFFLFVFFFCYCLIDGGLFDLFDYLLILLVSLAIAVVVMFALLCIWVVCFGFWLVLIRIAVSVMLE